MSRVKTTYRLMNAGNQHNFHFEAEVLKGDKIRVTLEAEDIGGASASVVLEKGGEESVDFSEKGATIYQAKGNFRWDAPYNVIRFEGNLRLANVAEIYMADAPVLELPN